MVNVKSAQHVERRRTCRARPTSAMIFAEQRPVIEFGAILELQLFERGDRRSDGIRVRPGVAARPAGGNDFAAGTCFDCVSASRPFLLLARGVDIELQRRREAPASASAKTRSATSGDGIFCRSVFCSCGVRVFDQHVADRHVPREPGSVPTGWTRSFRRWHRAPAAASRLGPFARVERTPR